MASVGALVYDQVSPTEIVVTAIDPNGVATRAFLFNLESFQIESQWVPAPTAATSALPAESVPPGSTTRFQELRVNAVVDCLEGEANPESISLTGEVAFDVEGEVPIPRNLDLNYESPGLWTASVVNPNPLLEFDCSDWLDAFRLACDAFNVDSTVNVRPDPIGGIWDALRRLGLAHGGTFLQANPAILAACRTTSIACSDGLLRVASNIVNEDVAELRMRLFNRTDGREKTTEKPFNPVSGLLGDRSEVEQEFFLDRCFSPAQLLGGKAVPQEPVVGEEYRFEIGLRLPVGEPYEVTATVDRDDGSLVSEIVYSETELILDDDDPALPGRADIAVEFAVPAPETASVDRIYVQVEPPLADYLADSARYEVVHQEPETPDFYVAPNPLPFADSTDPTLDVPWRRAVAGSITESDFEEFADGDLIGSVMSGALTVGISRMLRNSEIEEPLVEAVRLAYTIGGGEYGTVEGTALLNRGSGVPGSSCDASRIEFAFSDPVRGFGIWIFDDNAGARFDLTVTDIDGAVTTSDLLDARNSSYLVEGFLGVVSDVGLSRASVRQAPGPGCFELDHMQIAR